VDSPLRHQVEVERPNESAAIPTTIAIKIKSPGCATIIQFLAPTDRGDRMVRPPKLRCD
jgi:hypothetical protein